MQQALAQWCAAVLRQQGLMTDAVGSLSPLSGDASFRRYFRYRLADGRSWMAVLSPPEREKNAEFVQVRAALEAAGVRVPALLAYEPQTGFFLLSDLGDRLLLPALTPEAADVWYGRALGTLLQLQQASVVGLPAYDAAALQTELDLFPHWFLDKLLGLTLDATETRMLARLSAQLLRSALDQPRVFVHRDYHARNLMIRDDDHLAVIDFQDALVGPVFYDPVSLLKDCYVRWPRPRVVAWLQAYVQGAEAAGLLPADGRDWLPAFDAMGLQRHLKVLGVFARLWLRDGKPGYLGDLTRVMAYARDVLGLYPDHAEAAAWFDARVLPVARRQDWFREADWVLAP